jgi:hypothetical protein
LTEQKQIQHAHDVTCRHLSHSTATSATSATTSATTHKSASAVTDRMQSALRGRLLVYLAACLLTESRAFSLQPRRPTICRLSPRRASLYNQQQQQQRHQRQQQPSARDSFAPRRKDALLHAASFLSVPIALLRPVVRLFALPLSTLNAQQRFVFVSLVLGSFLLGRLTVLHHYALNRVTSLQELSPRHFGPCGTVWRGRVVGVTDGDTFRFLHQPTPWHPDRLHEGEKLSNTTLPVRIATIDTPETAKFGKPGQVGTLCTRCNT